MSKINTNFQLNLMPRDFESKTSSLRIIKRIIYTAVVFAFILIGYFVLLGYSISLNSTHDKLLKEVDEINQQIKEYSNFEANNIQSQLIMIRKILDNHVYWEDFFKAIEDNTLLFVQFNKLEVNSNVLEALLSGQAASYTALAQQIIIFEKDQKSFSEAIFSNINQNKNGSIGFNLKLSLSKNILFKLNE
ncbi:hypothetical protein CL633_03765 [bacterium]|nr:hypothetical protein [bacterium]|tara:strand:+ start:2609 stop:3178 length:570 start_codon:yes stop_codon:yes gene_type:complete